MTKALATFVKASYPPASRGIRGPSFAGEKVVASRSTLKWMSCGKAVVCSHAVLPNEGRKAFADYLVSADAPSFAGASDAEDADD